MEQNWQGDLRGALPGDAEQPWWADLECAPEGEEDILEEDLLNEDAWVVPGDESPEFNAMQHGAAYPSFAPASWGQPSMHPQAAYAHQAAAPYAQGHPPYMPGPSPHAPLFPRPPPGNPPPASSGVPPPQPPPFPPAGPPPAEPRLSGAVSGARFAEFRPGVGVVAAGGASEAQGGGGAGKEGEGDEVDWNDYYQGDPEADDNAEEAYAEDFLEEDDWFTGEDGDGEGGQQVEVSTEALGDLQAMFPAYSTVALAQVLHLAGGDVSTAGRIVTALESQAQGLAQRQQQDAPRRAQAHQPPPPPSAFPPLAEGPGEGGENPPDSWRTDAMGTTGLGSTVGRPGSTGAEGAGPGLSYAARGGMSFAGVAAKPGAPRGGGGRDGGAGRGGRGGRGSRGGGASAWEGRPARAIDWVETGTAVATEYAATRAEAIELARQRARLFDEAQLAYKAGNGSAAKKLSQEAWLIDEKMREAHRRAATAIFSQRNKAWVDMRAFGQAPEKEPVLDLHGLHVAEAVELLSSELPVASDIGIQSVHVLVGTQHHTAGKHSQGLAAGVRDFLEKEMGLPVREVVPGDLEVRI